MKKIHTISIVYRLHDVISRRAELNHQKKIRFSRAIQLEKRIYLDHHQLAVWVNRPLLGIALAKINQVCSMTRVMTFVAYFFFFFCYFVFYFFLHANKNGQQTPSGNFWRCFRFRCITPYLKCRIFSIIAFQSSHDT